MRTQKISIVTASVTVLICAFSLSTVIPVASAQEIAEMQAAADQALTQIPGSQQLPNQEQLAQKAKDAALSQPHINNAIQNLTDTPEPSEEVSTNPTCAPIVLVAVPGSLETNRDHDPNQPVGALDELTQPLRDKLGGNLSETYINYAADVGVSGTAYAQSVQNGVTKTLKTIEDVQDRCDGSRVVLTGFSQGAHVAGDVATMIGQKRTSINPSTMAGVVLFADPKREENSNILSGSSDNIPKMPANIAEAVTEMNERSRGQEVSQNNISGLANSLISGDLTNQDQVEAGSQTSSETIPTEAGSKEKVQHNSAAYLLTDIGIISLSANTSSTFTPQESTTTDVDFQLKLSDLYRQGKCGALTFEECYDAVVENPTAYEDYPDTPISEEDKQRLPKGNIMETRCFSQPVTQCLNNASANDDTANLPRVDTPKANNDTNRTTSETKNTTEENIPSEAHSATSNPTTSGSHAPTEPSDFTDPSHSSTTTPTSDLPTSPPTNSSITASSSRATSSAQNASEWAQSQAGRASTTSQPTVAEAGTAKSPEPTDAPSSQNSTAASSTQKTTTSNIPQAGEKKRPTTSSTPSPKNTNSDNTQQSGADIPLDGLEPITAEAVAGGGVAGQREDDFGFLTGAVVSICSPGDIVCSLPENSQLARDLVAIGENVSVNLNGVAKESLAGNTRMGGLMAVEATNTMFKLAGLPPLKLSADSIMALISLVSGAAMIHAGDPTGQGIALVSAAIPTLPKVLPELYEQIKDIPTIIEALPHAGDTMARNLGLDKILGRLSEGFTTSGMTDLTDLAQLPSAVVSASIDLINDNSGLMEIATKPEYLTGMAHSFEGFRTTILTNNGTNAADWYIQYVDVAHRMITTS